VLGRSRRPPAGRLAVRRGTREAGKKGLAQKEGVKFGNTADWDWEAASLNPPRATV